MHCLTRAVAVEARALLVLHLEQLEQVHLVARRRDDLHRPGRLGDHQPGLDRVEQLDATRGQAGQELDDVELVDERVRHLDEGPSEQLVSFHHCPSPTMRLTLAD